MAFKSYDPYHPTDWSLSSSIRDSDFSNSDFSDEEIVSNKKKSCCSCCCIWSVVIPVVVVVTILFFVLWESDEERFMKGWEKPSESVKNDPKSNYSRWKVAIELKNKMRAAGPWRKDQKPAPALQWDMRLERKAQEWADLESDFVKGDCQMFHPEQINESLKAAPKFHYQSGKTDEELVRKYQTVGGQKLGQNLAVWSFESNDVPLGSPEEAVQGWYDECPAWDGFSTQAPRTAAGEFSHKTSSGNNPEVKYISHYTQLMWGGSKLVGCAESTKLCKNRNKYFKHYVCHYGMPGNITVGGGSKWKDVEEQLPLAEWKNNKNRNCPLQHKTVTVAA